MILEIVGILLAVVILAVIINGAEDYCKQSKRVNMSFKEAMDLVDLPVITFYNNGKKFNFLLDTGATISIVDSNILDSLTCEKLKDVGTVFGVEGNKVPVSYVRAQLDYKGGNYKEDFQVLDMSNAFGNIKEESGVTLSGILGNQFFHKYQYVLDFKELIAYSKK